jgi:hypothetical protein
VPPLPHNPYLHTKVYDNLTLLENNPVNKDIYKTLQNAMVIGYSTI